MSENTETTTENKTTSYVTVPQLLELAAEAGCIVTEQKSFWRVEAPESNRKALYVGKTVRRATRVDIAGFELDHPAVSSADDLKNGAVTGQILFKKLEEERSEADPVEAFTLALEQLVAEYEGTKLRSKDETDEDSDTEDEQDTTDESDDETEDLEDDVAVTA